MDQQRVLLQQRLPYRRWRGKQKSGHAVVARQLPCADDDRQQPEQA